MTELKRRGILAAAVVAAVALVVLGTLVLPDRNREVSRRTEPISREELTADASEHAKGPESSAVPDRVKLPELPPELPEELAPLLDEKADLRARLGIVKGLGDDPGPETVEALFDLLDHPPVHETVRNEVAAYLGQSEKEGLPEFRGQSLISRGAIPRPPTAIGRPRAKEIRETATDFGP